MPARRTALRERISSAVLGALRLRAAAARAAGGMDGVYLVGGAVRDLLLGRVPRELDVVVEGDVDALAAALGDATAASTSASGPRPSRDGDCRWDLAAARAEDYRASGRAARRAARPDRRGPARAAT